jgi:hypothetical protein
LTRLRRRRRRVGPASPITRCRGSVPARAAGVADGAVETNRGYCSCGSAPQRSRCKGLGGLAESDTGEAVKMATSKSKVKKEEINYA